MDTWIDKAKRIPTSDKTWAKKAQARLDEQTRPQGSLGRLETTITKLAAIQRKDRLDLQRKMVFIFAGDHGVEREGVSLYPRAVTQAMVMNFLNGGATINALARQTNAIVKVVDVGVDGDFIDHPGLIKAKINKGTANLKTGPAMSEEDFEKALKTGWSLIERFKRDGVDLVGLGEMGIANTTPAAAVIAALLGCPAADVTGRGTGIDDDGLRHKAAVIDAAIAFHKQHLTSPFDILQRLGGYELAAMAGAILACATFSIPVVADGIVVAASLLTVYRLSPAVLDYVFLAHESQERGHRYVIEALGEEPLLNLSMRLGEGSGAALAFTILEAGGRVYNEVATFQEADVANKKEKIIVK